MAGMLAIRLPIRAAALVALMLVSGASGRALAQQSLVSSGDCGTENLLARRLPVSRQDMRGDLRLATDGQAAPEGAQWDAPVGVFFDTPAGSLTYDLGEVRAVGALMIQADANDTYKVFGATVDSPGAYKLLVEIESVVNIGHGLRTRTATFDPTPVRYIRIGEPLGDGFYSLSEFQAFCHAPTPFPPRLPIVDAPQAKVVQAPWWKWPFWWWEDKASARFEMVLAFLGLALLGWGVWLEKQGAAKRYKTLRDALLAVLGVVSFCAYWNFFAFHFYNYVHQWDTFHYYVGSKYFKEISYDRLYECVAVADSEEPGLRRRVELRKVMNLRTNMMEGTEQILAHPERCKGHFTPERWENFKHDVGHFRSKHDVKRWEEAQTDHGYNGTPVWNIMGTLLSNTGPASDEQIDTLTRIDPMFIIAITLMAWWAFGWRTTCVALAVLATNFPARFYWTGGAFLRWDWLFYFVGGVCLIKKDRPLLGGFFLGYSTLLRVFPMFTFTGPALVAARQLWGGTPDRVWVIDRALPVLGPIKLTIPKPTPFTSLRELVARIDRKYLRLFGGAALAVALLVPISLVTSNGIEGYKAFIFNTRKHKETPLTNYMGLKTVVIYTPAEAGRNMRNDKADPWGDWKKTKVARFENPAVKGIFYFMVLCWGVLLLAAVRNVEMWEACAMGATMMAVGIELTCYYYSFMFAVAFLYYKRHEVGAIILGITAATGFIDWAPTKYLPTTGFWANRRMPEWLDEQYTLMSVAVLAGFIWILYRFAYPAAPAIGEPVAAAAGSDKRTTRSRSAGKGGRTHTGSNKRRK
jgi:hypothetical protein